jgi:photosystem II stability/assembly factor-like uncharacterized protein
MLVGGDILATGLSTDAGWNWQQTSGFLNWELGDYTWHPTTSTIAWAGTLGGPYESTDGGHTWTSQRNGMPTATNVACTAPIQKIIFDPNNSNLLLAFGGNQRDFITPQNGTTNYGAVWKSTNGGANWNKIAILGASSGITGANIRNAAFAAGSSSIVYACSADQTDQIWISSNGGTTWVQSSTGLPSGAHVQNVQVHPTNPSIAWVSLDGGYGIYKTINGGASWTSSNTGLTLDSSVNIQAFAVAPSNGNVLYCGAQANSSQNSRTYSSTNGGASWNLLIDNDTDYSTIIGGSMDPNSVVAFKFLSVDPQVATHVVGVTEGLVLESWNSGATWYDICSRIANSSNYRRGTGYSGVCGTICKWNPYKPGQVFPLGLDDSKLNRSLDYMYSFTDAYANLNTPFDGAWDVGFTANNSVIYIATGEAANATDAIAKSTNGGTTWTAIPRPSGVTGENRGIYVSPADPTGNTIYSTIYGNSSGLYKTTNGGTSWTTILSGVGHFYNIEADSVNYNTIYVSSDNGIYKSTDGSTFNLMPGSPTTTLLNSVHVDPTNSTNLFAVGYRIGKVCQYNGTSWTQILNQYSARDIAVDPNNDQRLVVCTHGYPGYDLNLATGVYISTNGGSSWSIYNTGLRILSAYSVNFNPDHSGQLILGTDGGGFYATDLGTSTPKSGSVPSIVGTIQAEDYDLGGQYSAYSYNMPGNPGGDNYRTDSVSIKAEGTGHAISNTRTGEWLKYSVNVPSTGYYDFVFSAMSITSTARVHIEANGVNVTGPITIGSTGGVWKNISMRGVRLIAGNQYLKLYIENGGADIDYFTTEPSTNGINITNVSSGQSYDVGMSSLGAQAYIDEPYVLSTLTQNLQNLPEIQTAMADNTSTASSLLTFTIDQPGTVYVAVDKGLVNLPGFLSGWTLTSESVNINATGNGYSVYSKQFPAGTITLGGNMQYPATGSGNMYMVFVKRS